MGAILISVSASIMLALGAVHLAYTFASRKLHPKEQDAAAKMRASSPVISGRTTMWNAWIGFNASHSFGAILFGLFYLYLAQAAPGLLRASLFLQLVGASALAAYAAVAQRYWFRTPLLGILLAFSLYLAGAIALAS
ncbi:LIC_13387 family protein [Cupriavidus sp. USMAA2-4]|uniref:LIC_13387 family protein n=1 Tax=Cupriavidus sp. USMAA2-4 TaxID=876364 RepID=UPI000A462FE3|nr:hypothetical protein [Cupriavidus sp. USMAA2-4]